MYEIRSPKYNAAGTIDVELNHPQYGWIPFTASQDDFIEYGREIYAKALAMNPSVYVAPDPIITVPKEVTAFQARAALAAAGLLGPVNTYMQSLPSDDVGRLAWEYAQTFKRTSPTIAGLAPLLGMDDAQLDQLFIAAAQIDA